MSVKDADSVTLLLALLVLDSVDVEDRVALSVAVTVDDVDADTDAVNDTDADTDALSV